MKYDMNTSRCTNAIFYTTPMAAELTTRTRRKITQNGSTTSSRGLLTQNTFKSTFKEHFQLPLASSLHNLKDNDNLLNFYKYILFFFTSSHLYLTQYIQT